MNDLKETIFNKCVADLMANATTLKVEIANLRDGIANDSKSSMGDKYETSREMSQQEINRLEQQLAANKQQLFNLKAVQLHQKTNQIITGSLVLTNIGRFFIAISLGEIHVNGQSVFMISPVSPLGKLILGKKVNDVLEMNKRAIKILEIN